MLGAALGHETKYNLGTLDAIVLAAVEADLPRRPATQPKCFVSRDPRAFGDPEIVGRLAAHGCRFIPRFGEALNFIKSQIAPAG